MVFIVVFIGYKPTTMRIWWWAGWWFGTLFMLPYIGNNHPNWLLFFQRGSNHQPDVKSMYVWRRPSQSRVQLSYMASFVVQVDVIDLCLERHAIDFQPCMVSIWILICVCAMTNTFFGQHFELCPVLVADSLFGFILLFTLINPLTSWFYGTHGQNISKYDNELHSFLDNILIILISLPS